MDALTRMKGFAMKFVHLIAAAVCAVCLSANAQTAESAKPPLVPVANIDISRYQGTWHQIALYPNRFQKSCASNTRALYTPQPGGTIQVINQCRMQDGKEMKAEGLARPARATVLSGNQLTPPQLQVRFAPEWLSWLPMVWGNYWVIQLSADYSYAVVGEPSREYLWVLARETQISTTDWSAIEARLKEQGYDPEKLLREKHLP
jgi:apolipoprotein D and lipocalin family protein